MKIKCIVENPVFITNYLRSYGVIARLNDLDKSITASMSRIAEWHDLVEYDVMYLERPSSQNTLKFFGLAELFGMKTWIDYDDDLLAWPETHDNGKNRAMLASSASVIEYCVKRADLVTVSTPAIKDKLSKWSDKVHLVPNAFNDYNFKIKNYEASRNQSILWRGGETHKYDCEPYAPEWSKLAKFFPKWKWIFLGSMHEHIWNFENQFPIENNPVSLLANKPFFDFYMAMMKVNPAIVHVPLLLTEFNKAKSILGVFDAIIGGACVVGPDLPEWRTPGIELYSSPDEYRDKIKMLMGDEKKRVKNFYAARDYIEDNLLLSEINKSRLKLVQEHLA